MNKIVIHGEVTSEGELKLELPKDLSVGRLKITIESEDAQEPRGITLGELLNSDLVGMWADRTDIQDSVEFARELRKRASRRGSA